MDKNGIRRRQLGIAVAGMTLPFDAGRASPHAIETMLLAGNGWVPNNPRLPVLIYRHAVEPGDPARLEALVAATGWPAQWRNGIYSYHHYHSTAHEVLGIARGTVDVVLGGPGGHTVTLSAGDVVALPCGTGHCRTAASDDLLVIGAYPEGEHWDICRTAPDAATTARMAALPVPDTDPIEGRGGRLTREWRRRE